jgi:hypothetical protein
MSIIGWIIVICLVLFLVGGAPGLAWHHYNYNTQPIPSWFITVAIIVLVFLLISGRL